MSRLTIDEDFVQNLILRIRAVMAREEADIPDPGGNPTDDETEAALQDVVGDLSVEEVAEEIQGLPRDHQAELVALMWLGRGDAEPEDWAELVTQAQERSETATENYLLDHPLVADYIAEGLERLTDDRLADDDEDE